MSLAEQKSEIKAAPSREGEIPVYVTSRPSGVFIDLNKLSSVGGLEVFVTRMFTGGSRFSELDYDIYQKLLFDPAWMETTRKKSTEVKIAAGMVRFPSERQALYRSVKFLEGGKHAEYFFEPVVLEETYEEIVGEKSDEPNVVPLIKHVKKTRQVPAVLDFDEFVADMWVKGVKFGIDAEAVRKVLTSNTMGRLVFANHLVETKGNDADIQEVCTDLRRDNSPKTKLNGKVDLCAFKNRFPHICKDGRLLKKMPCALGKPGYLVTGEVIEPPIPKDINLESLISRGTKVVCDKDGEFIVASMDGFLNIDTASNVISITEKIESDAGISMKTTGDLMLDVDEFIERGDVQEGRVVKGRHMTFKGNVFGGLAASGNICIEGVLSGGRVESTGGNVTLARVLHSVAISYDGDITAQYCENSTIVANSVHIERAVNCEIVGKEVCADVIEGCLVAGESIKILASSESKTRETSVTLMIPDLSAADRAIAELQKKVSESTAGKAGLEEESKLLKSDQEFNRFLVLSEKIKSGEIKLTSDQVANWKKLVVKNGTTAMKFATLRKQADALERVIHDSGEEVARLIQERDATGKGIDCVVDEVCGQTTGQTMKSLLGVGVFKDMPGAKIRAALQTVDNQKSKIFSTDHDPIKWSYK